VVSVLPALTLPFTAPGDLTLVGAPSGVEASNVVSLGEARQLIGGGGGAEEGEREVRVPVSRNSLVQIVNGGVRLPGGVEQQLFVVRK
jgi:hypothetical protein